jgi:hypothetical protein
MEEKTDCCLLETESKQKYPQKPSSSLITFTELIFAIIELNWFGGYILCQFRQLSSGQIIFQSNF